MGGYGSGRWQGHSKADTVGECRSLDANRWMREGILTAGVWHAGSWCWFRDADRREQTAAIGYEVNTLDQDGPWLRLTYMFTTTKVDVDYRIALQTTSPRLGGVRWWFTCPLVVGGKACERRVGKLYLPPGGRYFGCRRCYGLSYTSCQESRKFDSLYRLLAKDTSLDFLDVKRAMNQIGKKGSGY